MLQKVIASLLVVLVMASTALGVYSYRLTGEIEDLGNQLETIRAEQADRIDALSDALEDYRQDTAAELDLLGDRAQEDRERVAAVEVAVADNLVGVEENSAGVARVQAEVAGLAAELAQVGEETWLPVDEVYEAVRGAVIEVSNGQATIGSGFVYDDRGHVITAHHVIEELTDIYVVFPDGRVSSASLVGSSDLSDVAVLKLDEAVDVAPLALADSGSVEVGEPALAIGSPFDLGGTVTAGIISQLDRYQGIGDEEESRWIANLVQFDAPANFGNSGGPLFNAEGLVVGLIIARVGPSSGEGISYAVSSNKVRRVADTIIETGRYDYPWLGVEGGDLTPEEAEEMGRDSVHGVVVATVVPGGPAWAAGVEPGDIVTGISGSPIDSMAGLTSYLGEHTAPGDVIIVEVDRDGTVLQLEVTLGTR